MDYKKIYDLLIEKAKNRILPKDTYFEKHHIIPICVGGELYNENNIVNLTAREHFIAHKLLCKIYKYPGIRYAYSMMVFTSMNYIKNKEKASTKRCYRISSREYEECRNFLTKQISKKFKGSIYINNGEIQIMVHKEELQDYLDYGWKKGKLPLSEEALESIREKAKIRVLSEATHIQKMNSVSGEKNPAYDTKMMNKDGKNKRVKRELIQKYLDSGWKLGMIVKDKKDRIKRINTKNINKKVILGRKYVHTETKPYLIRYSKPEDYDYYINVLKWLPNRGDHYHEVKGSLPMKILMFKKNPYEKIKVPIELKNLYLSRGYEIGNGNYYK